jgi:2-amino-4-hydroxy-6-hydroxymethyldihydropteridine diphosphokinase
MSIHRAALALGGNMGDVASAFVAAFEALEAGGRLRVVARSNVWRTPPWGKTDQPDFLNMCVLVETQLSPRDLLALCLNVETDAGRVRLERWGPRLIDIDVLAYDDVRWDDEALTLPHPRMSERAFVLAPLAEIAADWMIDGARVDALAAVVDSAGMQVDEAASALVSG